MLPQDIRIWLRVEYGYRLEFRVDARRAHLHGNKLALLHRLLELLPNRGPALDLISEEVPRREMLVAVSRYDALALRPFPAPGAAEHEHDAHVFRQASGRFGSPLGGFRRSLRARLGGGGRRGGVVGFGGLRRRRAEVCPGRVGVGLDRVGLERRSRGGRLRLRGRLR